MVLLFVDESSRLYRRLRGIADLCLASEPSPNLDPETLRALGEVLFDHIDRCLCLRHFCFGEPPGAVEVSRLTAEVARLKMKLKAVRE